MKASVSYIVSLVLIVLSFALGACFFEQLPEQMASHWNFAGEVDGYLSKLWGVILLPLMALVMVLIFWLIPKIDPLKKNIDKFRGYYNVLIVIITVFFTYIHVLMLVMNLGYDLALEYWLMPMLGILFWFMGYFLQKTKQNWFVGIRTPWTLSSPMVWKKTHALGSKVFYVYGFLFVALSFLPDLFQKIIIISLIVVMLLIVVYSFVLYQKEKH